jgi:hypothetical protein
VLDYCLDPEVEAQLIRRAAGLDDEDVCSMHAIATALQIGIGYYPQHVLRGLDAKLFHPRGLGQPPEIALRRGLAPRRRAWWIAHEVAERHLLERGYRKEDAERAANAVAAALMMPSTAFRVAAAEHDFELVALSDDFAVDETAAALRLAEVGAVDAAAIVGPTRVYARTFGSFVIPAEPELRRLARSELLLPGLRKVRLTDQPRRVALIAAAG